MDQDVQKLQDELAQAERKMRLIQDLKAEYILPTDIPLQVRSTEDELQEKIDNIKAKITTFTERKPSFTDAGPRFPVFQVPLNRNPNFSGRKDVLATIRQHLPTGNSTVLVQTISGLGGVGKTQSAIEFAYQYVGDYDLIWWVRTESDELFTADYATLVSRLNLPVKTAFDKNILINLVRGWLAATSQRWLLIFDNAETPDQLQDVLPVQGNGHVIITSRNPNWRHLGNVLHLNEFALAEASAFLIKRTGDTNQAAAEQVAALLGKLPLALEQAAAFMSERGMPLTTYATLYIERRQELWQRTTPPRNYPATVLTTWEMAFQQIQQAKPAAAHLLNLCAFLAPDNISITMIRSGAACLSPILQAALENLLEVEDLLAMLYRYSLISRKEDTITIHRLVQEVTQDRLNEEERKRWLEAAVHLINRVFPFDRYKLETWSASGAVLPHLTIVVNCAEKQQVELELVATLWQNAARYLREQGEYIKAQSATEQALKIRITLLGEEHIATAESLDFLGQLKDDQADYQKAKLYYERSLKIRQYYLGQEHEDVAMTLNNLGTLLKGQGEYEQAHSCYEQALTIRRRVLGDNHPDMAASLNNLGGMFQVQGEYGQARNYYEQALTILRQALGNNHPNIATCLGNLGVLFHLQGEYGQARSYHEQALTIRRQVLGDNHPNTATSLNNLGGLLKAQGEHGQARSYYEQALTIRRQVLGDNHPDTAASLNNIGTLFQHQGDYGQARSYYEQALTICRQVLSNNHPDTAASLNNLGMLFKDQGDYGQARSYVEQALTIRRQLLGDKHPDTALYLNNLGTILMASGHYVDARSYLEEALHIYDKMYPKGHPNLVTLLNTLSRVMIRLKQVLAARQYLTRAAEICKNTTEHYPECDQVRQTLRSLPGGLLSPKPKKKS